MIFYYSELKNAILILIMQKGFAPILIVILVAVLGIGGYFVYTNAKNQTKPAQQVQTTQTPTPSQDPTTLKFTDQEQTQESEGVKIINGSVYRISPV